MWELAFQKAPKEEWGLAASLLMGSAEMTPWAVHDHDMHDHDMHKHSVCDHYVHGNGAHDHCVHDYYPMTSYP